MPLTQRSIKFTRKFFKLNKKEVSNFRKYRLALGEQRALQSFGMNTIFGIFGDFPLELKMENMEMVSYVPAVKLSVPRRLSQSLYKHCPDYSQFILGDYLKVKPSKILKIEHNEGIVHVSR